MSLHALLRLYLQILQPCIFLLVAAPLEGVAYRFVDMMAPLVIVLALVSPVVLLIVSGPTTLCIDARNFTVSQPVLHLFHPLRLRIYLKALGVRVFCHLLSLHKGLSLSLPLLRVLYFSAAMSIIYKAWSPNHPPLDCRGFQKIGFENINIFENHYQIEEYETNFMIIWKTSMKSFK